MELAENTEFSTRACFVICRKGRGFSVIQIFEQEAKSHEVGISVEVARVDYREDLVSSLPTDLVGAGRKDKFPFKNRPAKVSFCPIAWRRSKISSRRRFLLSQSLDKIFPQWEICVDLERDIQKNWVEILFSAPMKTWRNIWKQIYVAAYKLEGRSVRLYILFPSIKQVEFCNKKKKKG